MHQTHKNPLKTPIIPEKTAEKPLKPHHFTPIPHKNRNITAKFPKYPQKNPKHTVKNPKYTENRPISAQNPAIAKNGARYFNPAASHNHPRTSRPPTHNTRPKRSRPKRSRPNDDTPAPDGPVNCPGHDDTDRNIENIKSAQGTGGKCTEKHRRRRTGKSFGQNREFQVKPSGATAADPIQAKQTAIGCREKTAMIRTASRPDFMKSHTPRKRKK